MPGSVARTVPDGVIWIVRDIDLTDETGTVNSTCVVNINGGQLFPFTVIGTATSDHHGEWRGRQVLNPGDILTVSAFSDDWAAFVSGYVLSAP